VKEENEGKRAVDDKTVSKKSVKWASKDNQDKRRTTRNMTADSQGWTGHAKQNRSKVKS
jgi:hypothetical protein